MSLIVVVILMVSMTACGNGASEGTSVGASVEMGDKTNTEVGNETSAGANEYYEECGDNPYAKIALGILYAIIKCWKERNRYIWHLPCII